MDMRVLPSKAIDAFSVKRVTSKQLHQNEYALLTYSFSRLLLLKETRLFPEENNYWTRTDVRTRTLRTVLSLALTHSSHNHKTGTKTKGEKPNSLEEIYEHIANVGEQANTQNGKDRAMKLLALPMQMLPLTLTVPLKPAALPVRPVASNWSMPSPEPGTASEVGLGAHLSGETVPGPVPAVASTRPASPPPPAPASNSIETTAKSTAASASESAPALQFGAGPEPSPKPPPKLVAAQPPAPPPAQDVSESAIAVSTAPPAGASGRALQPSPVCTPESVWSEWTNENEDVLCLEKVRLALRKKGYTARFIEHFYCHLDVDLDGAVHKCEFLKAYCCLPKGIFLNERALSDEELLAVYDEVDVNAVQTVPVCYLAAHLRSRGVRDNDYIDKYLWIVNFLDEGTITRDTYARSLGVPGAREKDIAIKLEDQLARLREIFDKCEMDGCGTICLEKIRIVLKEKGYSDHFVERLFPHLDMDRNGEVTREEFYQALKFVPKQIFISDHVLSDEKLLALFDEADTDRSGALSWPEFKEALVRRGFGVEFTRTYFEQLDLDGEQEITREQFARCMGIRPQSASE